MSRKLNAIYYENRGSDADVHIELPEDVEVQTDGDEHYDAIGTIYEESERGTHMRAVLVVVARGASEEEVRRTACLAARLAADELFSGEDGDDDSDDDDGPDDEPDGPPTLPEGKPSIIDTVGRIVSRVKEPARRRK